jgi:hypothetical protein
MSAVATSWPWPGDPSRLRPVLPLIGSAGAALGLVVVLALLVDGPQLALLQAHLVVLVLATGAAYLLDDRAAQVTVVVPRSLLRRRLEIVAAGFVVAAAGWGAVVLLLERAFASVPIAALTVEAAGLFWIGAAVAAVASRHDIEPGNLVASTIGLVFIGLLLSQPLLHETLLVTDAGDPLHAGWWALTILASLATLTVASRN